MIILPMPPIQATHFIDDKKIHHMDNTGNSISKNIFNGQIYSFKPQHQVKKPIDDSYQERLKNEKLRTVFQLIDKSIHSFEIIKNEDIRTDILLETVLNLVESNSHNIVFEKTNDDSILIKAKHNDYNYYLEIFEDDELNEGYEAVLNVYENGQNVLLHSGSINELYEELLTL